jgi:exodeoxyribonuclease V alpha subunit
MNECTIYKKRYRIDEGKLAYLIARHVNQAVDKITPVTDGLVHKQPEAVENACSNSISILTGPPGTGKTTTSRQIVNSFLKAGMRVALVAPTGKASKRADEVINEGRQEKIKCRTTHSFLEFNKSTGGFTYNIKNKIEDYDALLMDEFSMQDLQTMSSFLEAVSIGKTRVVFIGDQYQLPSVGPGNVAKDLIKCGKIKKIELDVVMRTGKDSGITYNANRILRGLDIETIDPKTGEKFTDFFFVESGIEKDTVEKIKKWICEDIPNKRSMSPLTDVQLMCPGRNSVVGVKNANEELRQSLNKMIGSKESFCGFKVGDKVINKKNNIKINIVNGDIGYVKDIENSGGRKLLVVNFGPNTGAELDGIVKLTAQEVEYQRIALAYATTIHASQGSETPIGIVPIHPCHSILLTRNLVYTGLTRAKQMAILVGKIDTMRMAIKNTSPLNRTTRLSNEILKELSKLKSV